MLGKFGRMAIVSEDVHVFLISFVEVFNLFDLCKIYYSLDISLIIVYIIKTVLD